ncbi:MAG: type II toxin-antitoxin system HicB family antitoxin [Paludibacteraceae bacterium]|nr:type II toxin-antitoxin system HicB family antitoxin [Paludibacteraceae bacterium]
MKTTVLIELGKDGSFGLHTPDLENIIIGNGATLVEAKADFDSCLNDMKASYIEDGEQLPEELKNLEFEYKYDTASALEEFSFINLAAFSKIVGINDTLMRRYKKGEYISRAQAQRIQDGINQLGRKMAAFTMV